MLNLEQFVLVKKDSFREDRRVMLAARGPGVDLAKSMPCGRDEKS